MSPGRDNLVQTFLSNKTKHTYKVVKRCTMKVTVEKCMRINYDTAIIIKIILKEKKSQNKSVIYADIVQ